MKRKRTFKVVLITISCILLTAVLAARVFLFVLIRGDQGQQPMQDSFETYTEVLQLSDGRIRGYMYEDTGVEVYKGIPYAAAPTGELRWKAPQDVTGWTDVRDCVYWSDSAMQAEQNGFMNYTREFIISNKSYSEDCLYLNVWTTSTARESGLELPVIVYIHGGAYNSGGASCEIYQGQGIAQKGAVFVSINYRLGVFGYYSSSELLAEDASAGNYGLMDQIKALEWVRQNIAQFGGDPDNVTVMGQSAGAGAVQSLIISPKAKGLFSRAVVMSYNAVLRSDCVTARERAQLGDKAANGKALAELRATSAEELMKPDWSSLGGCVDGVYLTGTYLDSVVSGDAADVDLMIGAADNTDTPFWSTQTDAWLFADTISGNVNTTEALMGGLNYQALAREYADCYDGDTYIYNFSHMMPYKNKLYGTTHTSDVPYFLNIFTDFRNDCWTEDDYLLGDRMSSYLVNFAATGNPNGEGLAQWRPSTGEWEYMNLDTACETKRIREKAQKDIAEYYSDMKHLLA